MNGIWTPLPSLNTINSICVPRSAKEATGALISLEDKDGSSFVVNVEYNQLDPVLRATVNPDVCVSGPLNIIVICIYVL